MPTQFKGIPLASKRFIQWLNLLNIVPGFYGINSTDLMTDLYHKGVHTLVTDRLIWVNNSNQVSILRNKRAIVKGERNQMHYDFFLLMTNYNYKCHLSHIHHDLF